MTKDAQTYQIPVKIQDYSKLLQAFKNLLLPQNIIAVNAGRSIFIRKVAKSPKIEKVSVASDAIIVLIQVFV